MDYLDTLKVADVYCPKCEKGYGIVAHLPESTGRAIVTDLYATSPEKVSISGIMETDMLLDGFPDDSAVTVDLDDASLFECTSCGAQWKNRTDFVNDFLQAETDRIEALLEDED